MEGELQELRDLVAQLRAENGEEWIEEVQACIRARHLSTIDQAFFLFDHLEGEAHEIKYRSATDRSDPVKIITILRELYCIVEAFFSRRQHDGETLQEFSLALLLNVCGETKCAN